MPNKIAGRDIIEYPNPLCPGAVVQITVMEYDALRKFKEGEDVPSKLDSGTIIDYDKCSNALLSSNV